MPLMFNGGRLLFADTGQLAWSANCCCDECCGCDWLTSYWQNGLADPLSYRIKLEFSGSALSGTVYLVADPNEVDECMAWINDTGGLSGLTDNCDYAIGAGAVARLICPSTGTSFLDFQLSIDIATGNCSTTTFVVDSGYCGSAGLSVTMIAQTDELVGGGCTCGDGVEIQVLITNADSGGMG